jgi:hypothetical protein
MGDSRAVVESAPVGDVVAREAVSGINESSSRVSSISMINK